MGYPSFGRHGPMGYPIYWSFFQRFWKLGGRFFKDFGSFTETTGLPKSSKTDAAPVSDERSERASAASEASGASRSLRQALRSKHVPRDLFRKAKRAGGNQKNERRFPFHVKSGLCWRAFFHLFDSKTPLDGPRRPKTPPRRPQDGPRLAQDAPRRAQHGPKTAQDDPETA